MSTKTSPHDPASAPPRSNPLALIAGPTASGKSACAVSLAKALSKRGRTGVVINADSAQVYDDLAVLSARPTQAEMNGIEHRLFGEWDGAEPCSAADWAARAKQVIGEVHGNGNVPILVGGTGLYIKVLLDGIAPIPAIEPEVREVVRAMDTAAAYSALMIEDPLRAAMLNPGDSQRIARALEVKRSTGVTLGDWQQAKAGGIAEEVDLHPLVLMPDRTWLYRRCAARFEAMLDAGAIAEVEALLERGLDPGLPVMRAIGVPQITAFVRGEMSREAMIEDATQSTRNYAKRQFTWLRNQLTLDWPVATPGETNENVDIDKFFARLLSD